MQLLGKNRVADFDAWWAVFRSHAEAHRAAGLHLRNLWRNADDPNEVFFLFQADDRIKAQSFMSTPEAAASATESGVMEGSYSFVEEVEGD